MTDGTTKHSHEAEEVIKNFLSFMLEKDMDQWIELWDDKAIFEFPYAPKNYLGIHWWRLRLSVAVWNRF